MCKFFKYFVLILAIIFCGNGNAYAQKNSNIDSIMRVATLKIYENLDQAIQSGMAIYKNPANDLKLKIRGLMLVSDGYSSKRDYQKSLEFVNKASELSEQLDNPLLKIKIINKIAVQHQQLKIYDKAIQYLDQSERMCLAYPQRDSVHSMLGSNYIIRAFIYKEKLNCDIAISFFDRGIAEYRQVKTTLVNPNLSIVHYNKGNCYMLMADNIQAKASFEESIAIAKSVDAPSLQAFAQKGLAEVYTLEGKYQEAIDVLQDALVHSKNVGDLVLNQGIYKGLSENYLALNQWENYQKYHNSYLQTQLKIKESERKSISDSLSESEKVENSKLDAIIPNIKYGISIVILVVILALGFYVFSEIKTRKSIVKLQKTIADLQKTREIQL